MNIVFKILLLILILGIEPFCLGMIPSFFIDRRRRKGGMVYIAGFMCSLALFQVMAVPITILDDYGFPLIVVLYTVFMAVLSVVGIVLGIMDIRTYGNPLKWGQTRAFKMTVEEKIEWVIVALLILLQLVMYFLMASFDGDDAYYVVQSLLSTETDTLYRIKPYTGLAEGLDIRHAMASVPLWEAYIARMIKTHSTIVAHSVIGLVIIPVIYIIYYECGAVLFRKDKQKLPIFMIFICIMHIFGNVSIYTNATFLLTRTWQGKSMLANMVIAFIVWLFLAIFETDKLAREWRLGYWLLLFVTTVVAAMCSTASVFLIALLIGVMGLCVAIKDKDFQIILRLLVVCTPLIVFATLYLLV